MGQKVNPVSIRLVNKKNWHSLWYGKNNYRKNLIEDLNIRDFLKKELRTASVEKIDISRSRDQIKIDIFSSKPGMIIGRSGQGISDVKIKLLNKILNGVKPGNIQLNITEIKVPELYAELVAQNIGNQISHRIAYRKASKQAIEKSMQKGALGIKIQVSGRLNGVDIARSEKFFKGSIPLNKFNANIDYAVNHANTKYGIIGIKVWLYKKDDEE